MIGGGALRDFRAKRKGKERKGGHNTSPEWAREGKKWVLSGSGVRDSGALRMKEKDWKRQSEGERAVAEGLRAKLESYVTVSEPQEQQRKAVNGSSPCLNRLWTVAPSTANHQSSWRLLWVWALTRCLPPDQGDDSEGGEWRRQEEGGERQRDEEGRWCYSGEGEAGLQHYGFVFSVCGLESPCYGMMEWIYIKGPVFSFICLLPICLPANHPPCLDPTWGIFYTTITLNAWPLKACHMAGEGRRSEHWNTAWRSVRSVLNGQILLTLNVRKNLAPQHDLDTNTGTHHREFIPIN